MPVLCPNLWFLFYLPIVFFQTQFLKLFMQYTFYFLKAFDVRITSYIQRHNDFLLRIYASKNFKISIVIFRFDHFVWIFGLGVAKVFTYRYYKCLLFLALLIGICNISSMNFHKHLTLIQKKLIYISVTIFMQDTR